MAKKVWKRWTLNFTECTIERSQDGVLNITTCLEGDCPIGMTPTEARRLFQKLRGDYKD